MSRVEPLDLSAFKEALEHKRIASGLSARQLCRQIGLSESTYSRVMHDNNVSLANFAVLSNWLGQPVEQFMSAPERDPSTRSTVAGLLAADPVYVRAKPVVMAILDMVEDAERVPVTTYSPVKA